MMRTFEFVYYLLWVGVLIGALRLAEVRPLGAVDGDDCLANLDWSFGLVHRLVFADAAWLVRAPASPRWPRSGAPRMVTKTA